MTSFTERTFTIPAYPISKKVTVGTSGRYVTLGVDQCAVVLEPTEVGPIMLALIAAGTSITETTVTARELKRSTAPGSPEFEQVI